MNKFRMMSVLVILALIYNVNRKANSQAKRPWDFFPELKPAANSDTIPASIEDLKIFLPNGR